MISRGGLFRQSFLSCLKISQSISLHFKIHRYFYSGSENNKLESGGIRGNMLTRRFAFPPYRLCDVLCVLNIDSACSAAHNDWNGVCNLPRYLGIMGIALAGEWKDEKQKIKRSAKSIFFTTKQGLFTTCRIRTKQFLRYNIKKCCFLSYGMDYKKST